MAKLIEVTGLRKAYGAVEAIKGLDFYVEKGQLFAFLGPNGAGKSTTIDIICTFLRPDEGIVKVGDFVLGVDDDKIRHHIGAVFQYGLLDEDLSVEDNLKIRGRLYGLKGEALKNAVLRAATITDVTSLLHRPYGKLSGGQKRRCDIARGLIHTPDLLFLDEPTTGLDPQTRQSVWETILKLQKETAMTIFLTTHYMEEAKGADYIVIIDGGEIAAQGTPSYLKETYCKDQLRLVCKDVETVAGLVSEMGYSFEVASHTLVISLDSTRDALPILNKCDSYISSFEVLQGTLDDAFIAVTGKEMR